MGARFLLALLTSLAISLILLGGAGYAISRFTVPTPRNVVRSPTFEFQLAPGWQCRREGSETTCMPADRKPSPAVIIFAEKERGKDDTLDAYRTHLQTPQKRRESDESPESYSEIKFVRERELGGRVWVESLHVGSELKNWETYYLATVTSYAGILVTLSSHQDYSARYIAELSDMIRTLRTYEK
jgi:hypothetical protein